MNTTEVIGMDVHYYGDFMYTPESFGYDTDELKETFSDICEECREQGIEHYSTAVVFASTKLDAMELLLFSMQLGMRGLDPE